MIIDEVELKAARARKDGYVILAVPEGNPIRLDVLIEFAQSMFPNHALHQLAITQAENDQFVVAAQRGIDTKPR